MARLARFKNWNTVPACNMRTVRGNRQRKDLTFEKGTTLPIAREFSATGMATHGMRCLALSLPDGREAHVMDYEVEIIEEAL